MTQEKGGADPEMKRFRERAAALIGATVLFSFVLMLGYSLVMTADADRFGRAKDLLGLLTPIVGVVVGYYFNKASTESRAEAAEGQAEQAEWRMRAGLERLERARLALGELRVAAEHSLDVPLIPAGAAGDPMAPGPENARGPARNDPHLERALRRARQVLDSDLEF